LEGKVALEAHFPQNRRRAFLTTPATTERLIYRPTARKLLKLLRIAAIAISRPLRQIVERNVPSLRPQTPLSSLSYARAFLA